MTNLNPLMTQEQFIEISRYIVNDILNSNYDFETMKRVLSEELTLRINTVWEDMMIDASY